MGKIKQIFTNGRVIILMIMLVLSVIAISPNPWAEGVAIRSVGMNTSAALAGIRNPEVSSAPMSRELVLAINNVPITSPEEYYNIEDTFTHNMTVTVKTNKATYTMLTQPEYKITILPELENITINDTIFVNKTVNGTTQQVLETVPKVIQRNKTQTEIIGVEDLGLSVYEAPKNNIRKGLDLAGGTRVVLKPETTLNADDFDMLLASLKQRLNIFGLSDIIVRKSSDLTGDDYILIEIAGAKKDEVRELLSSQGKFEALVGETKVFIGGEKDIVHVCRSSDCSGLDPYKGCGKSSEDTWVCSFYFSITLSELSAKRLANATGSLGSFVEGEKKYLTEDLQLFLDDKKVNSLRISSDLGGRVVTDISISGSGSGPTEYDAAYDAIAGMKELQTVLITGSLPTKLEISQMTSISPKLGADFIKNALFVGLVAIMGIIGMVLLRYRKLQIAIPIAVTLFSEVIIVMGFAALIGWNIDLAAIAGILIVIGTSVDHQIVITDELLRGQDETSYGFKDKIKKALFIIMGAYFTTLVAMLPLIQAGAGLLRGFAITTIVGVTIGVLVTRRAFAAVAEILLKQ